MVEPRFRFYGGMGVYTHALASFLTRRTHKGDDIAALETTVAERLGVPHAVAAPQARVALYLVIKNTIRPGQNVVMSPFTIYDVVNMVIAAGGRPKFADIRETCNLAPSAVEAAIDSDTGAVLTTHLHGLASDLHRIAAICEARNVPLIEDAAQAYGANIEGRAIGAFGQSAILSFGRAKNINAFFGGMAVTRRAEVAEAMRRELAEWGFLGEMELGKRVVSCAVTDVLTWGPFFNLATFPAFRRACLNDVEWVNKLVQTENNPVRRDALPEKYRRRLTPMQARLIMTQHPNVDRHTEDRRRLAGVYEEGLRGLNSVGLPPRDADSAHIYQAYPIIVENRMSLVKHMMREGCDVAVQHYHNTADLACFRVFFADCPAARRIAKSVVLLPTYPGYSERSARKNVAAIRGYLEARETSSSQLVN